MQKIYESRELEAENIGRKLDSARKAQSNAKSIWAKNYWQQNIDVLLLRWNRFVVLYDVDFRSDSSKFNYSIDHNYLEKHIGPKQIFWVDILFNSISECLSNRLKKYKTVV